MPATMRHGRLLVVGLLLIGSVVPTGCLSFCHPVIPPPKEELEPYLDVAKCQQNAVHVFFVHGIDPLDFSNYEGLHAYVQSLGYIKTYYGWPYHAYHFEKQMRKLRQEEPDARLVLIGFSYGAGLVRDMACSVRAAGIDVDLVVYIDGVLYNDRPLHRPANVCRVVNILSCYRKEDRAVREAENHRFDDVWHFGTVTHPQTLRLLARELGDVARKVPIVQVMPVDEGALPAPKEVLPAPKEVGGWEYLRPDGHAQGVPGARPAAAGVVNDVPATASRDHP